MQITLNLRDALYLKSEELVASRGVRTSVLGP
jgi:hypothetical protein